MGSAQAPAPCSYRPDCIRFITDDRRILKNIHKIYFQNGKSSLSPTKTDSGTSGGLIMPQKKPVQNPHLAAQDGVRSDLLKAIRDGKYILE